MSSWTQDELSALDRKYAEEGIHVHQRPFRAAKEILGSRTVIGSMTNPEVQEIVSAYTAMVPEAEKSWPGSGLGFVASVDQVKKVTLPVVFGTASLEMWQVSGFGSPEEHWSWCRQDKTIAAEVAYATADIFDLVNGVDEVKSVNSNSLKFWHMARCSLEDIANCLPTSFNHDSVLQPICMVAELSIKGALVWSGRDPNSFRGKGGEGHNIELLAQRMVDAMPHRDDQRLLDVVLSIPYVASRYSPKSWKRIQVVRIALGVQFIAASCLRRISTTDLASQLEGSPGWPGARAKFLL